MGGSFRSEPDRTKAPGMQAKLIVERPNWIRTPSSAPSNENRVGRQDSGRERGDPEQLKSATPAFDAQLGEELALRIQIEAQDARVPGEAKGVPR